MLTRSSYLVQRLKKPFEGEPENLLQQIVANGLAATGLTPESREVLNKVCRFDYMGSSEYEFGAIPRILAEMSKKQLIATRVTVPYYFKSWRRDSVVQEGHRDIAVICCAEDLQEVTNRILKMAVGDPSMRCKERHEVDESLAEQEYSKDVYGWLELDNGYMFFKDKLMFEHFCALFGIKEAQPQD